MNGLERYLQALARDLHIGGEERERILGEFRQHLEESRLEFIANGHSEAEAERLVLERIGDPREISRGFSAVYRTSPIRFVLNLFARERTAMRLTILRTLDWVFILGGGLFAGLSATVFHTHVLPRVEALLRQRGQGPQFGVTIAAMGVFDAMSNALIGWWWLFLILIAACVALIRYRSAPELRGPFLKLGASLASVVMVGWMLVGSWAAVAGFVEVTDGFLRREYAASKAASTQATAPAAPEAAPPAP